MSTAEKNAREPPGAESATLRPALHPACRLPLSLAVTLPVVAALLLGFGDARLDGAAWPAALLLVAGLALAGGTVLLARRHQAMAAADAARHAANLGTRIAEGTAALAASEARLRRAQRIGRVGGFEINLMSGVNQRSGEYMAVQGLPGEDRLERHQDWVARLHPEDRERAERHFLDAVSNASGVVDYAQEYRIRAPSGETRWIAARAEIERDAAGRAIRMVGAHVDVTELKVAEAARHASEERLRLAQEAAGIGIWERDLRTGRAAWSAEQFRLMGLDPTAEPPDRAAMRALVLPEDRDTLMFEQMANGGAMPERQDGSFRHTFRIRRPADGDIRSVLALGRVFAGADGRPARLIGVNLDITDRARAEQRQMLLVRELDHRAKNALAVVQAALRLTPRDNLEAFARAVEGRVRALTRAHTLLADSGWSGADLRAVLRGELEPLPDAATRVALEGPQETLAAVATQPLAMAMHELSANALQHGALSNAGGGVLVRWWIEGDAMLRIDWIEAGGPPIAGAPARRGFGSRVIDATLGVQLGGTVHRSWAPGGLACAIALPVGRVIATFGTVDPPPDFAFDVA